MHFQRQIHPCFQADAADTAFASPAASAAVRCRRDDARMRTLGIDLASQARGTAVCVATWGDGAVTAAFPPHGGRGFDDAALLAAMGRADWIAIDAPFGWPDGFRAAIGSWAEAGTWPLPSPAERDEAVDRLRFRLTDRDVRDRVPAPGGRRLSPLSVSSDRIAFCAWRAAWLLAAHAEACGRRLDRVGVPGAPHGVIEAYPAGALELWGVERRGYKARGGSAQEAARSRREEMLATLERALGGALTIDADACTATDHAFDAFVCALVARAAATGQTRMPPRQDRETAAREGWIHLPATDSLARLARG